jgi:hypothetical protein
MGKRVYGEGELALLEEMQSIAEELDDETDLGDYGYDREWADAFSDWDTRVYNIELLRENVARVRGRWLADQRIDYRDRPGPPPSLPGVLERLDRHVTLEQADESGPGCFVFPPPPRTPGERDWRREARQILGGRKISDGMIRVRFDGPLAMDLALGDDGGDRPDLDNLAYKALAAFEEIYLRGDADVVQSFRAYTVPGRRRVRMRILPVERLERLDDALVEARELQLEEAASRRRV